MFLKELKIINFRNYHKLTLHLKNGINILYGENGQGKTNLLESIYFLGITKSHRFSSDQELIYYGENALKVSGKIKNNNLSKKLEITLLDGQKKHKCDSNNIRKVNEYMTHLNVIIFYPEDLEIIKGSPKIRRKYVDTELSQLNRSYCSVINDFQKILKMRNEYLKNPNFDDNYFEILDQYFIQKCEIIYKMRDRFIKKINEYAPSIYKDIMKIDNFHISYKKNDFEEEVITKEMLLNCSKKMRYKEKLYGTTLFGPQRDDIEFFIGENSMKYFASQGQQRAAVLSLKLSEIEIFKKNTGETPILLLDDVFSELDKKKKNNLLKYIEDGIIEVNRPLEEENTETAEERRKKFTKQFTVDVKEQNIEGQLKKSINPEKDNKKSSGFYTRNR